MEIPMQYVWVVMEHVQYEGSYLVCLSKTATGGKAFADHRFAERWGGEWEKDSTEQDQDAYWKRETDYSTVVVYRKRLQD